MWQKFKDVNAFASHCQNKPLMVLCIKLYLHSGLCRVEEPRMRAELGSVPACNGWAGGAAGRDLAVHAPLSDWSKRTGGWDVKEPVLHLIKG